VGPDDVRPCEGQKENTVFFWGEQIDTQVGGGKGRESEKGGGREGQGLGGTGDLALHGGEETIKQCLDKGVRKGGKMQTREDLERGTKKTKPRRRGRGIIRGGSGNHYRKGDKEEGKGEVQKWNKSSRGGGAPESWGTKTCMGVGEGGGVGGQKGEEKGKKSA